MRDNSVILMPGRSITRVSFCLLPLTKTGKDKNHTQYHKADGNLFYLYGPLKFFRIKIFWGNIQ